MPALIMILLDHSSIKLSGKKPIIMLKVVAHNIEKRVPPSTFLSILTLIWLRELILNSSIKIKHML